jgi:hypothetical protein
MMILFGLVFVAVALTHRLLIRFAPSNLLIRRYRQAEPSARSALILVALGTAMVALAHAIQLTIPAGGDVIYLAVVVLAWDGLKLATAGVVAAARLAFRAAKRARPRSEVRRRRHAGGSGRAVNDRSLQRGTTPAR